MVFASRRTKKNTENAVLVFPFHIGQKTMSTIDKILSEIRINRAFIRRVWNADKMIYSYADVPALDNRVNLHIGDQKRDGYVVRYRENLGDRLAIPICEFLLGKIGIHLDQPVKGRRHLFSIGSGALGSFVDGVMWGSGIMFDGLNGTRYGGNKPRWWEKYWDANHRKLDIRAVRGPLTREVFLRLGHKCPEIYGDPGILMPLIYPPPSHPKKNCMTIKSFRSA